MNRRTFLQATSTLPLFAMSSDWAHAAPAPAECAAGTPPSRTVALGPGRIETIDTGRGEPILFIHGWPLNGTHWRPVIARLAGEHRCIAPDLMGLGKTEVDAAQDLSPAAQVDMLGKLVDALAIDRFHVVANDSGTCIAQLMAVRWPDRVQSLLLTNGDVDTNSPPAALAPALAAAREGHLDALLDRHFSEPGFAESPSGLGGLCYTDPRHLTAEAMQRYFGPLLADAKRRRQFQAYGVAFEPNPLLAIRSALASLPVPARMVWGTGDIHFPTAWAYWLDDTLPNARGVREVPGAKLFFTEEFPDLVADEIRRLVAG